MRKTVSLVRWLGIPALAAAAASAPVKLDAGLAPQDLCAQTGSCISRPGDICFVNGNPYYDRCWSGDSKCERPAEEQ